MIEALSDEEYRRPSRAGSAETVGAHVRHSIDHLLALVDGAEEGLIDYEARHRGSPVETSRQAACEALASVSDRLGRMAGRLDVGVGVVLCLSPDLPNQMVQSTLGREAAFVHSHTIHHNALMAAMLRAAGVSVPEAFGYAPSTLAFQRGSSCAH